MGLGHLGELRRGGTLVTWKRARGLGHLGDLWSGTLVTWKESGKTLCEILTAADAMPLPVAGPRADGNLFRRVLRGRPSSEAATVPGADCHSAVAMPPPCKPFWSKNHAIRPCSDAFQGNPYFGNLPFFGKFRTNRQLAGIQEPYSLHIVEGNGPGSSGAGWNGGGRVQNKPNMLYESRQTRLGQLAAKKYGTVSAGLMRKYDAHPEKARKYFPAVARLQAGRCSRASLRANPQTPDNPFPCVVGGAA